MKERNNMKKTIKKTWNKPTIVQLGVVKTAGKKHGNYEVRLGEGTYHAITSKTITS